MATVPRPSPAPSERFYLPELDALRFFAFLSVFISHLPIVYGRGQPFWSHLLGHGVDLFFALSAYLLTELMLREKEVTGRVDLRAFYVRRCLRDLAAVLFIRGRRVHRLLALASYDNETG